MKRRAFHGVLICLVLYWVAICVATHLPARDLPDADVNDKLVHLATFALLSVLLNTVLHHATPRHRDWLTLAVILAYAALDEWLQPLTGRSCDLLDWLADSTGAAAGMVLCNLTRLVWTGLITSRQTAGSESEESPSAEPLDHR